MQCIARLSSISVQAPSFNVQWSVFEQVVPRQSTFGSEYVCLLFAIDIFLFNCPLASIHGPWFPRLSPLLLIAQFYLPKPMIPTAALSISVYTPNSVHASTQCNLPLLESNISLSVPQSACKVSLEFASSRPLE